MSMYRIKFDWKWKYKSQVLNAQQSLKNCLNIFLDLITYYLGAYQHYQSYGYVSSKVMILNKLKIYKYIGIVLKRWLVFLIANNRL